MTFWRRLFRRRKLEHELDGELQFHFEQQVRDYLSSGMSENEARREVRLAFGTMDGIKEECREVRRFALIDNTIQDIRYAARVMRKGWVFSSVVVLSLTLGIGANTAIFTLIDAIMWRSLPIEDPQSLLLVGRTENENPQTGFTYEQFKAMRENTQVANLAGYSAQRISVSIDGNFEPTMDVHLVSGNYFSLLGVNGIAGRTITEDDVVPNGHPVAMISYRYWTSRFARDPAILGKTLSVSGTPFTIIGVSPPEFFGVEVGTAVCGSGKPTQRYRSSTFILSQEEVDAVLIQERLMATLSTLLGGLALLLASVGLYGLLAFAVVQRTGEVGIRMALGALRSDVVWMILREAVTLVLTGVAIGVPAALLLARVAGSRISGLLFGLRATDPMTIGAATTVLIIVGIVAAYVPARRASRVDPMVALRNE